MCSYSEPSSNLLARLREVRTLIVEHDPQTMAILDAIKMLRVQKGLILPPLHSPDQRESRSAKKAEPEETADID